MDQLADRNGVDNWLKDQPNEINVIIAARSALRGLPDLGNIPTEEQPGYRSIDTLPLRALPAFRAALASVIGAKFSTDATKAAAITAQQNAWFKFSNACQSVASAAVSAGARDGEAHGPAADAFGFAQNAIAFVARAPTDPEGARGFDAASAAVTRDAISIVDEGDTEGTLELSIWHELGFPTGLEQKWNALLDFFESDPATWEFWREWYQGFLDGKPLNWELQRRVALIPNEDWEKGPAHIAEIIEEIQRRLDVEQAAKGVEQYIEQPISAEAKAANPMIGHNRPPPDEVLPVSPPEMQRLLALVQLLQVQMQVPSPDLRTVKAAAEEIEEAERKIGGWMAEKLNMSAEEFFKEFGKWGGRMAVAALTATGLWFFGLLQELAPLLQALRNLLAGLAG